MKSLRFSLNAPFTLGFACASVIALILGVLTNGQTTISLFSVGEGMDYANPLSYLRMFCHVLGHRDPNHLVYNLSFLLLLGPMLEERHGIPKLLLVTMVTALVTAVPMFILPGNLLGASGVVFAFIIMSSYTRAKNGTIPLSFALVVLLFLGREIYLALSAHDSIAQFAHILGGAVGGYFAIRWK
jgi:GlpG protein